MRGRRIDLAATVTQHSNPTCAMPIIPFYGSRRPDLFALERRAMDRPGLVTEALDLLLPAGRILDIGAGDGFLAGRLTRGGDRTVVPLEPDAGMIALSRQPLPWVRGQAEALPFTTGAFAAVYSTWAWFFPGHHSIDAAVLEAERVVTAGGVIAIVANLGGDDLSALAPRTIAEPVEPFRALGFALEVIHTVFAFDSLDEARVLLAFYFGDAGRTGAKQRLTFRVGLYHKRV